MKKEKILRFLVYVIATVLMLGLMPKSGKFLGDYRDKLLQIYPTAKIELVGEKLVCEK